MLMTRCWKNINAKLDDFSSAIKNQLSFNKMLETQLADAIPCFEKERIPGKPEEFMETTNLVTSRYDFGLDGWGVPIKKGDPRSPILLALLVLIFFKMQFVILDLV